MPASIKIASESSSSSTAALEGNSVDRQTGDDVGFFGKLRRNRFVLALAIFLTAFALRFWQNSSLEHRVWYCADAQNYLRSGRAINVALTHASSVQSLVDYLQQDAKKYSGMYQAFGSDNLVDRLSVDGPIFSLYLAAVQNIVGIDAQKPQYEEAAFKISVANSFLDSLTCVILFAIGTTLFGLGSGAAAGVIYALYPAAIVNTQWCMSENFSAFMLVIAVWALTRLVAPPARTGSMGLLVRGTVCGLIVGLTALTRPLFPLLLPFLLGAVGLYQVIHYQAGSIRLRTSRKGILAVLAMVASFMIAVAPWLIYTQTAFGHASLCVKRLPAYNLISGNMLIGNGWTPFPTKLEFPEDLRQSTSMILADAAAHPAEFALLESKKVARLWSGVWNDCKYSVAGIPVAAQTVLHQLLLFLSFLWFVSALSPARKGLRDREVIGSLVAGSVIGAHALYLAFISMNRYAFTSMPFVALTAGAMIMFAAGREKQERSRYLLLVVVFAVVAALTNELRSATSFFAGFTPANFSFLVPWAVSALAILAYLMIWIHAYRCLASKKQPGAKSLVALAAGLLAVGVGIIGSVVGSYSWTQWKAPLTSDGVIQRLFIPANLGPVAPTAMVILDLQDDAPLPLLALEVNGHSVTTTPTPLSMLQLDNDSIVKTMAIQSRLTDKDFRAYRHWFAVTVPSSQLRFGEINSIKVANADRRAGVSIYGDYLSSANSDQKSDGVQHLPSITALSWNHAVESCEYAEPVEFRFPEMIDLQGQAVDAARINPDGKENQDLSSASGHQWGRYRVRVLVRPLSAKEREAKDSSLSSANNQNLTAAKQMESSGGNNETAGARASAEKSSPTGTPGTHERVGQSELRAEPLIVPAQIASVQPESSSILLPQNSREQMSDGGNPATFYLTPGSLDVTKQVSGHNLVRFVCELKTEKKPGVSYVNIIFTNSGGTSWTSSWLPDCIPVTSEWKSFAFQDILPPEISKSPKVSVQIVLTPFTHDLLFNGQRKAMKRKVFARNAKLEFSQGNAPARSDLSRWTVL